MPSIFAPISYSSPSGSLAYAFSYMLGELFWLKKLYSIGEGTAPGVAARRIGVELAWKVLCIDLFSKAR